MKKSELQQIPDRDHGTIDLALGLCLAFLTFVLPMSASPDTPLPPVSAKTQLATLGGGCFWCLDAAFRTLEGVQSVACGYAGGNAPDPTYQLVCAGTTGHAEVVQIGFDPAKISYEKLLEFFWKVHDPTTLNRQGPDSGHQYRSIILYHDEAQRLAAEKSKQKAAAHFRRPIVTEIVPLKAFYRAEEYHQNYFARNPNASYCVAIIQPKLEKLKKH